MAEKSVQTPKKRQFLFNPLKRPMPYIGLILAILIVIFQGTIRQYTANVVGEWLANNLRTSTQGNYTLEYEFVRFDIFTKELRIQNLELKLDTTVTNQEQYLAEYSNLLDLSTPIVVLKLESLWDLIVNDKLRIAYIGMKEPAVSLIRSEMLSEEETEENQQQTTETIRTYLEEVEIDSFRILNGSLRVDLQDEINREIVDFRIADFTTLLRGFQLHEINPNRPFQGIYVEEIELEVKDQNLSLPQANHDLSFERLWVSSIDSTIVLDSIKINPIGENGSGRGEVFLKQLALRKIDFRKIYDDYALDIGELDIDQLDLSLSDFAGIGETTGSESDGINLSVLPFKEYSIGQFRVIDSKLDLGLNRAVKVDNLNIGIKGYKVDSADLSIEKIAANVQDFEFNARNTLLELPDSVHQVRVGVIDLDSKSTNARLSNIRINPIENRRKYNLYKERGASMITYGSVYQLILNGVNYDQLIQNQQLLTDSLIVHSPSLNVTQYPYISPRKSNNNGSGFQYLVDNFELINGKINFNRRQNQEDNRTVVEGINLSINSLYPENETTPTYDQLVLDIESGSTRLNNIKHQLKFRNLRSLNLRRFDVSELTLLPDSNLVNSNKYDVNSAGISLIAYSRDFLSNSNFIEIEEFSAQSITADINIVEDTSRVKSQSDLEDLVVNRFYFNQGNVKFRNKDVALEFNDLTSFVDSLQYSLNDTASVIPIKFKDLLLTHSEFKVSTLGESKFELSGRMGKFSEHDSLISFSNLAYKIDQKLTGTLEDFEIKGFEREKFLLDKSLSFNYALFNDHKMEYSADSRADSKPLNLTNGEVKNMFLSQFSEINFDSLIYRRGNIQLKSDGRITSFNNCNLRVNDYKLDSTTNLTNVLRPEDFVLNISNIVSKSTSDSIDVTGISLDLINNTLFTGSIDANIDLKKTGILQVKSPGIVASGFDLSGILSQDYSIDTVQLNNTKLLLASSDSIDNTIELSSQSNEVTQGIHLLFDSNSSVKYDSTLKASIDILDIENIELDSSNNINFRKVLGDLRLGRLGIKETTDSLAAIAQSHSTAIVEKKAIPTNGQIGYLGVRNTQFEWYHDNKAHDILGSLNLDLALHKITLDSLNTFNIYNHIDDFNVVLNDYTLNLPDSLNSLSFDRAEFSSKEETIEVTNLGFTPLVNKYDYANRVGRQAGWHHLHGLNIKLAQLDIHRLIKEKVVHLKSLETFDGTLDIFKDKELPIPSDQYRPMLQDAIKGIDVPFLVDSISVDNFLVNLTSRLSSDLPEGSLNFHEINAKTGHLTNIDTLILDQPHLKLEASTKIMDDGLLVANFDFNMDDLDNSFEFTGHLNPMSARDFNSLLEATAYVSIESGDIKDIKLEAKGNNYYALGSMTFQYNNLKVSTINKNNLKTTGMGKVMKTFFANAFVVKKNNPAVKFFPRKGDMYYERDTQKIIIDYVAKAAMSGVVSSIGARNFRKDIKRIQKESKQELDEAKKAERKAKREATIP